MRNFDDTPLPQRFPQRFRLPEKDTRKFYERPEWWAAAVKWGIATALLLGALGFGAAFATGKWKERKKRLEIAAQEARLREHEEAKVREEKAAREKAEKEAREKARAEAKAEKERIRRERMEAEEQRKAELEQKRRELEAREKGPRRVADLEKQQDTAGVRWWGLKEPPKFAGRREGDEYWCVFTDGREDTMIRVKVGPDKNTPAAVDLADGQGFMRAYERELLEEAVSLKPHLVIMDRAAWVRIPQHMLEKAAHTSVPKKLSFRPAEALMGESLYNLVRSRFGSNERLDRLDCNVEFHWRGETHPPLSWKLKFTEYLGSAKISHEIEDTLQAELDAVNAAADKAAQKKAERQHSSLASRGSTFAGGAQAGRRLGENYKSFGGSSTQRQEQEAARQSAPSRKERVDRNDVQRVIEEGFLSASFVE